MTSTRRRPSSSTAGSSGSDAPSRRVIFTGRGRTMFGLMARRRAGEGVPCAELLRAILPHNVGFQRCQPDKRERSRDHAGRGVQGRLGRCRLGRAPVVTDDDIRASPFADGSEREPIVSRHARGSSTPVSSGAASCAAALTGESGSQLSRERARRLCRDDRGAQLSRCAPGDARLRRLRVPGRRAGRPLILRSGGGRHRRTHPEAGLHA